MTAREGSPSRNLDETIDQLFVACGLDAGALRKEVRVCEYEYWGPPLDSMGRIVLREDRVVPVSSYVGRFGELLGSGLPWIEVTAEGRINQFFLVSLQPARYCTAYGRQPTKLAFAGPPLSAKAKAWDVSKRFVFVPRPTRPPDDRGVDPPDS